MAVNQTLLACILNFCGGGYIGYNLAIISGLAIPFITCTVFDKSDDINVSLYQGLFNGIIYIIAGFSSYLIAYLAKKLGNKKTVMIIGIVGFICPLLAIISNNFWLAFIGRSLSGFAVTGASTLLPPYSSTLVPEHLKSRIATVLNMSICAFIFCATLFNLWLIPHFEIDNCQPLTPFSWKFQLGFPMVFGLIIFICSLFTKEDSVIDTIVEKVDVETTKLLDVKKESLWTKSNVKYIVLALMSAIMTQITGISCITFYAPQLLQMAGIDNVLLPQMLISGVWNVMCSIICMFVVNKISLKTLMLSSLIIMFVGSAGIIIPFFIPSIAFVVIIGMVVFILGFQVGVSPLFYVICAVSYPSSISSQACSLANLSMWLFSAVTSIIIPPLFNAIGVPYTELIFALCQVIYFVYVYFAFDKDNLK
ncbi:hypothetical protein WA158_003108 [Blastocystis sp. Blastoise]